MIYDKQKQLQENLGYDFENMTVEQRVAYIKEYTLHCTDELHEMLRELPYLKPWKKYTDEGSEEAFMTAAGEFADVLHFIFTIAIGLGIDADDMYNLYVNKNAVNYKRQENKEQYKMCAEVDNEDRSSR